jgi:hypothetical protein
LARWSSRGLHVVPKVRTPPAGISLRSLSRYVCVPRGGVRVVWDKLPNPQAHVAPEAERRVNILLLPWPLTLQDSDFVPVESSVRRREQEPYGFFRYEPAEALDLDVLERTVASAVEAAGSVEVVVLPEGSVADEALDAIEEVLGRWRVSMLIAGVREPGDGSRQPANWVYLGVRVAGRWRRYRQTKHHRWSLDASQIGQYHLDAALDPGVRWWEDMGVPRRSIRFLEFGGGVTMISLICEDLARLDDVAELVRSVGPSLVVTPLLDGPQLSSRWTARYASVLADDPGSAVVTLSCLGMVERSRPPGLPPSRVVALWKDPVRGLHEIELEDGADGVLVTAAVDRTHRHTADGRPPSRDTADFYDVGVQQIRALAQAPPAPARKTPTGPPLDTTDLSILTAWAEAVASELSVASNAEPGAAWRAQFGVQEPEGQLATGLNALVAVAGGAFDGSDPHRLASRLLRAAGLETKPGP